MFASAKKSQKKHKNQMTFELIEKITSRNIRKGNTLAFCDIHKAHLFLTPNLHIIYALNV